MRLEQDNTIAKVLEAVLDGNEKKIGNVGCLFLLFGKHFLF